MKNNVKFDKELKEAIKETTTTLAKAVKSTLGPEGTNALVLSEIKLPMITNDGVTVANSLVKTIASNNPDSLTTRIAQILNTVSKNTEEAAGDGTTSSITLAEAIILEGLKNIEAGFSAVNITKGIQKATQDVLEQLEIKTIPVLENNTLLKQVSTVSANNDEDLGGLIATAFSQIGPDGQIHVKDSAERYTYVDKLKGITFPGGYESNMFINTTFNEVVFENAKVLIYEGKFNSLEPILEILKETRNKDEEILIIAEDYSKDVMNTLTANKIQHGLKICAVRAPGFGEEQQENLEDIATITNAKIVAKRLGHELDEVSPDHLGEAKSIKVTQNFFTIVEDKNKEEVNKQVEKLKTTTTTDKLEQKRIENRIAKLQSGIAILYVHANSPMELAEKKFRVEDAINATRAAIQEGVLPGGGTTLLKIKTDLETKSQSHENRSQEIGYTVLLNALEAPIKTICQNADVKEDVIINAISENKTQYFGYDAKDKTYGNLVEKGILDPKKVTRAALQNASSVSQLILTLNCAIF